MVSSSNPLDFYKPGVTPYVHDPRDLMQPAPRVTAPTALPRAFSLPESAIENQGPEGSCGAFGSKRIAEWELQKQGLIVNLSAQFQYAETRKTMNTVCQDSGSDVRASMEVFTKIGAVSNNIAPYQTGQLCWVPDNQLESLASSYKAATYYKGERTVDNLKSMIYGTNGQDGHKVSAIYVLYRNFQPDANGCIPMPLGDLWGGHWMTYEGWNDDIRAPGWLHAGAFKVANQWDSTWGLKGYCYISYDHFMLDDQHGGQWSEGLYTLRYPTITPPHKSIITTTIPQQWYAKPDGSGFDITQGNTTSFTFNRQGWLVNVFSVPDHDDVYSQFVQVDVPEVQIQGATPTTSNNTPSRNVSRSRAARK